MQALSTDLLDGAAAAAEYLFNDPAKRRVVYHLVESGDLPAIRMGKKLFFRKSELDRAFQSEPMRAVG